MVYRVHQHDESGRRTFEFEGLLDREALDGLLGRCALGPNDRLVLRAGTEVSAECVPLLLGLQAQVVADSPYLARWLATAARRSGALP